MRGGILSFRKELAGLSSLGTETRQALTESVCNKTFYAKGLNNAIMQMFYNSMSILKYYFKEVWE
ncbi:hypothetical protein HMPREF1013_00499 [Bacillus sp. 2_A_57_CT2]|nr:hypothetical protein HMPREF1013_00499 [Bacillus sp. 2_A_57_CT2]